jgi:hypothetical protein
MAVAGSEARREAGAIRVSPEARVYALEELCRRAGLGPVKASGHWRMRQAPGGEIALENAAARGTPRLVFPAFDGELSADCVVRKAWLGQAPPAIADCVPDFVVPFARRDSIAGQPLFLASAPGEFRCTEDLLASTALVLSRFEEIGAATRDEHGRLPSTGSLATRDGYLDRPIVDEYGLAIEQVMRTLDPGFRGAERRLRVKVSHDVDLIGIPFSLRESAVQLVARRAARTALGDLFSFTGSIPGSLRQVITICEETAARGLRSALYWKASPRSQFDSGYDISDARIARVVDWARSRAIEMGVHPGYGTYMRVDELRREVELCRRAIGSDRVGGRQHYLRWSPATWEHWEQCGLAYDSSVGYADRAGFRAGTCVPYRPWLWTGNRRAELLEAPLILMDRTLVSKGYMGLSPEESLSAVKELMRKCGAVGGVLTVLWHSNCMGRPYAATLSRVLDELAGTENYDWEADVKDQRAGIGLVQG